MKLLHLLAIQFLVVHVSLHAARAESPEQIQALQRAKAEYSRRVSEGKVTNSAEKKKIREQTVGQVIKDINASHTAAEQKVWSRVAKDSQTAADRQKIEEKGTKISPNQPNPNASKSKGFSKKLGAIGGGAGAGARSGGGGAPSRPSRGGDDTSAPEQPTTALDGSSVPKEVEFSGKKKPEAPAKPVLPKRR
jgi:hypothetical protein